MTRGLAKGIPQIIAVIPVSREGKVNLKKIVLKHLGVQQAKKLFLDIQDEILLSANNGKSISINVMKGNTISLPKEALNRLDITGGSLVGLVQRENAVAVKRVEIVEEEGEKAKALDIETTYKITRKVITNPLPEEILPRLEEKYRNVQLKYDVGSYLRGRKTVEAWQARRILGILEESDADVRNELIKERLDRQEENGSWENDVILTTRNLRELAELGITGEDGEIQKAVNWLLDRPESQYNPGMWFLTDKLVEEQEDIVGRRKEQTRGPRERFRKRLNSEIGMVKAGDDLIRNVCGPRIMWPNALVLEALLAHGYEENNRVQMAIQSLVQGRWCECAYQHGFSIWSELTKTRQPVIEEIEKVCVAQYKYGGLRTLDLLKENVEYKAGTIMPRKKHIVREGRDEYTLAIDDLNLSGCEIMTAKALSRVKNPKARRMAEAHLWRFAGLQHGSDGEFDSGISLQYLAEAKHLEIFSFYDNPISRTVILRSVPWILKHQNQDGSWGEGKEQGSSTLAVIRALRRVELI